MGLFKIKRLKKGEKGLQQALEINKKFAKKGSYKYCADFERAVGRMERVEEGYSTEHYEGYDGIFKAITYYNNSYYKKDGTFVWKYEHGYYADDDKKIKRPMSRSYFVIQKNEKGRYEITKIDASSSKLGPLTKVVLGIGTDAVNDFNSGYVMSALEPERKMLPEEEAAFDRALKSANTLEDIEIELNKKKDLEEVKSPEGPEVKNQKVKETENYNQSEVELPKGPEVKNPEDPEMGL